MQSIGSGCNAGHHTEAHAHGHGCRGRRDAVGRDGACGDGRGRGRGRRHVCSLQCPHTAACSVPRSAPGARNILCYHFRRLPSLQDSKVLVQPTSPLQPRSASRVNSMESLRPAMAALRLSAPRSRCLHMSAAVRATPLPHPSVPGPPPEAPAQASSDALYRVARKRKQAELLRQAREARTTSSERKTVLQKRFWKDVSVKRAEGHCALPPSTSSSPCH